MWDSINNPDNLWQRPSRPKKMSRCTMDSSDCCLDKENLHQNLSPMKSDDLSMYDNGVVPSAFNTGSPCGHNIIRRPLEDHDTNSQDSGYGASYENGKFLSYASPTRGSANSFESGSLCSMEDEFLEDFSDVGPLQNDLPEHFNKLINGPLVQKSKNNEENRDSPKDAVIRPLFRRALSLQNTRITPNSRRVRSCLFKSDKPFKRSEHPSDVDDSVSNKRSRIFDDDMQVEPIRPPLQRHFSATEESIKCAVQRSSTEPDLIGDFSKNFCLPLTRGRHQDLKSITSTTLAELMRGEYQEFVASFKVIDCRYPYEFEGGHIDGAINLYTKEQCLKLLENSQLTVNGDSHKRHILVFHCEFSSERGPNLYRYLRKEDRLKNESDYPSLNYPEIYLLEGGYKKFFEEYSGMCVPESYKEMLHPDHEQELRHFRQKSKTWNIDSRQRPQRSLKRLL